VETFLASDPIFIAAFQSTIVPALNLVKAGFPLRYNNHQSKRLPWNKLIKFCEHFVNLNPVFEVLFGTYMGPFVYHYPAHMGGPILAS